MPLTTSAAAAINKRVLGTSASPRSRRARKRCPSDTSAMAVPWSAPDSLSMIAASRTAGGKSKSSATKRCRVLGLRSLSMRW
ncbi:hypothetical protein FQZ97_1111010 [compost metagenome]